MNPAATHISIIIPTHNRSASTRRLLDKLAQQTYPAAMVEVIVIANSCTDDTINMLREYNPPFAFQFAETDGAGPAVPRNKGASLATGTILIFLDDDVDPTPGLAEAHVRAHDDLNTVVMGYLPLAMPKRPGYFRKSLQTWWENKFHQMNRAGHRFTYEDLLSGNFSISADLYKKVNGFITTLRCRDDYELGIRLMESGANFKFSKEAKGIHRDEVTDLDRSLKRKEEEGRTDVRLWRMHPHITNSLQNEYRERSFGFPQSKTASAIISYPKLTDKLMSVFATILMLMEKFNMHYSWRKLSYKLLTYWYYRGLLRELQTKENLISYFEHEPRIPGFHHIDINLKEGLSTIEAIVDRYRPHSITIWNGSKRIGTVPYTPGAERLRGSHLRRILQEDFHEQLISSLALDMLPQLHVDNTIPQQGITVVVCTRNRTAQLSNCLSKLLNLSYSKFEIIVVDNAPSDDKTKELTANLPLRYIREERAGLDWARNRGIAEATYDIVAFTDDDAYVNDDWLHVINNIFSDEDVMGASGFVKPAELETPAQLLFEEAYGGMGHGQRSRYILKEKLTEKELLWASNFGIGANMAFRKKVFDDIGMFDTALDVGTPSSGGGDVEMFHRLVAKGHLFKYDPAMSISHYHRRKRSELKRQIFNNGRSFGCYLIDCYRKRTVKRSVILEFAIVDWFWNWNIKNLFSSKSKIPAVYTLHELWGMFTSPLAYRQTKENDKRIRKRS
jgi:glycosyltransferase involved in cell wall biosynthesis